MFGIDSATWTRVSPLLDEALELPPGARAEWLERLRAGRAHDAALVEALLGQHDRLADSPFLEATAMAGAGGLAGASVGAYTLDTLLGSGGMGSVWRAHRSDGRFEGAVAVKLLHLSTLDGRGAERFAREATALARLGHPHIARLYDAGVTAGGQPYLVLQLVEGTRLDEFVAAVGLDIAGRLALGLQVCDAVAHAHAHLVVHRDIKPSNILVDGRGQAMLLDFGIAQLVDGDGRGGGTTMARGLTPEFAAPEQVRDGAVTTATDVYALGVLLYRLLTGVHPTGQGLTTAIDHARAVLDATPRPASAVAPARWRRRLAGDLDVILDRALRKVPAERYQTVTALADDLRRHLAREPILARADRWPYRAGRFVRRHTVAVGTAAAVATALSGATVVTTNRMLEARRQRDQAEFQARRAEASSEFMRFLVTQIGGTPMTMREVLDRGRVALEQEYAGEPAFVARMLMQLSGPYIDLGDYSTSAGMVARALAIARTLDDPPLLMSALCGTAEDLVEAGDLPRARIHLAEWAALAARSNDEADCAAEVRLARAERRHDDEVRLAERVVRRLEREGRVGTTSFASALGAWATALGAAGRLADSLAVQQRVTAVNREHRRGSTVAVVVSLNNEAGLLRRLGRWRAADARFTEAAALARGADRAGVVPSYLLVNHARVLVSLARRDAARAMLRQARNGAMPATFLALSGLVEALLDLESGSLEAAANGLPALEQPPAATTLPTAHLPSARLLAAMLDRARGRVAEARVAAARALEATGDDPARPELLEFAARLAIDAGDADEAARQAQAAIADTDRRFGAAGANAIRGRARLTLGQAWAASGRREAARAAFAGAVADLTEAAGVEHPWTAEARAGLAALSGS